MEEVKVSFYKISTCGYYSRGDYLKPHFGELDDILSDLVRWGKNKRLAHTKTFEAGDGGSLLPAYLVDVSQSGDDWLLTLWNESHNTDGSVSAIDGRANVGSADVADTEVEEGHIPGHATYFWFMPKRNLMASVRFQHPTTGVVAMNRYLQNFVSNFTSHVVRSKPDVDGQQVIVGYRLNKQAETEGLIPRFKTKVYIKLGPLDYIIDKAKSIRKLKKRSTLDLKINTDKSMFQKLLSGLNLVNHQTLQQKANILYEVQVDGLEEKEAREIVNQWREEDDDDTDYGFVFQGEGKVHWLGKAYVRETLEFDVTRDNTELVQPKSLLRELARHRNELLKLLN